MHVSERVQAAQEAVVAAQVLIDGSVATAPPMSDDTAAFFSTWQLAAESGGQAATDSLQLQLRHANADEGNKQHSGKRIRESVHALAFAPAGLLVAAVTRMWRPRIMAAVHVRGRLHVTNTQALQQEAEGVLTLAAAATLRGGSCGGPRVGLAEVYELAAAAGGDMDSDKWVPNSNFLGQVCRRHARYRLQRDCALLVSCKQTRCFRSRQTCMTCVASHAL